MKLSTMQLFLSIASMFAFVVVTCAGLSISSNSIKGLDAAFGLFQGSSNTASYSLEANKNQRFDIETCGGTKCASQNLGGK